MFGSKLVSSLIVVYETIIKILSRMKLRWLMVAGLVYAWLQTTNASILQKKEVKRNWNDVCPSGTRMSRTNEVVINEECHQCGAHCSHGNERKRIINGKNALKGEFPWHASIFQWDSQNSAWRLLCGGVLVSPQFVLTAAHCFKHICVNGQGNTQSSLKAKYRVSIGEIHIRLNEQGQRTDESGLMLFDSVECHDDYSESGNGLHNFDAALIHLTEPSNHPIACIGADKFDVTNSRNCFGIGHGKTNSAHRFGSSRLQKVRTSLMNVTTCQTIFTEDFSKFANAHACASSEGFGTLVGCKLDSGSPVICPQDPNDSTSPYVVRGLFANMLRNYACHEQRASVLTNMFSYASLSPATWVAWRIDLDPSSTCDDIW